MRLWLLKIMDWFTERFFDWAIARERSRLDREHKQRIAEDKAHYMATGGRGPFNGKPYGLRENRPRQGKTAGAK